MASKVMMIGSSSSCWFVRGCNKDRHLSSALLQRRSLQFLLQSPPSLRNTRVATPGCYSDAQISPPPSTSIENLKEQLEALSSEAEQARARANAARARFMRLTETIENLRMRAIVDLKSGKEESARQLVAEKQKVMQALEKSKQRAELLEELCTKLGEAISSKEVQLIAALSSSAMAVDESNKTTASVRIVLPKADDLASDQMVAVEENGGSAGKGAFDQMNSFNDQNIYALKSSGAVEDVSRTVDRSSEAVNAMLSFRPEMYSNYLSKIDKKLHEADIQLHDFLNVAAMLLPEDVDINTNEKVATVKQIWHDVRSARARIRKAVQQEDFG
eukprot:c2389_g1_i1 orf=93-1085(+)